LIANRTVPRIDLAAEKLVQDTLLKLADEMRLCSAHDCSDGGLAVAIAESCFSSLGRKAIGAEIDLAGHGLSPESLLFGESPSRIVISFSPDNLEKVTANLDGCPFEIIGKVAGNSLNVELDATQVVSGDIIEIESIWASSLRLKLET
jgi:phosphoribosylformylglycinamidine (FGAM) synthase-like enzyme